MAESITITDNRTGSRSRSPSATAGCRRANGASCSPVSGSTTRGSSPPPRARARSPSSTATQGILRYRGYPIEQLAEHSTYLEVAYLLLHGELPTAGEFDDLAARDHAPHLHPRERTQAVPRGVPLRRPSHGDAGVGGRRAVDLLPRRQGDLRPRVPPTQIIRLIAKMPTLAAAAHRFSVGMPFVYPDNSLDFTANFLSMMWKIAEPRFEADPALARALDVLFILHADHEQNCSTTAMRVVGSSHADPYSCCAAACAALYGPRHGGANEAVIRMLTDIGSIDNVARFINSVKEGSGGRLQGFGHRVYKNYDPRARIIKQTADEVFAHHRQEPAARHRARSSRRSPSPTSTSSPASCIPTSTSTRASSTRRWVSPRDVPGAVRHPPHRRVAGPLAGDARPGLQDRPAPPALHRPRAAPRTSRSSQR